MLLLIAPVLSGILLFLAFPGYDLTWLAWVALVPILLTISGRGSGYGFLLSFAFGFFFFTGVFSWMFEIASYRFLHHAVVCLYRGFYLGLFGLAFSFIARRSGVSTALLAAPFMWVSMEYLHSNMGFMSHPWALLAHSQYQHPIIIQIASLTGTYGIAFLIVGINAALAAIGLHLFNKRGRRHTSFFPSLSRNGAVAVIAPAAVLTALAMAYGKVRLLEPIHGEELRVSLVQANIVQKRKWDPKYKKFIMRTYTDLTKEAAKDHPELIVWPEAATPMIITRNPRLKKEVGRIAADAGCHLLLGSTSHQKFKRKRGQKVEFYNSAFLINPEGSDTNQRYDKIRLVPFGEYLPERGTIPWQWLRLPHVKDCTPGKELTIFEWPGPRFGVNICWEITFPDLVSDFVNQGAQFIVNLTNEAWFGKSAAPYLMLSMSVFRAVENRIFMVRCANTGVSCFIDPYGRITARVEDQKGEDLFVRGVLTETVRPMERRTIFTRYGDWFVWVSSVVSAAFLVIALFRKKSHIQKTKNSWAWTRQA